METSHKLNISVTDFKKLVSRVQKGEKESRIAKKEMVDKFKISHFHQEVYK